MVMRRNPDCVAGGRDKVADDIGLLIRCDVIGNRDPVLLRQDHELSIKLTGINLHENTTNQNYNVISIIY